MPQQTREQVLKNVSDRFNLEFDINAELQYLDPEFWAKMTVEDEVPLSLTGGVDRKDGSCTNVVFRAQDAEPLLDQASSILDRALADRNMWQSLMAQWCNLRLDLWQSGFLEAISEAEEKKSRFDFEADLASSQKDARDRKAQALSVQQGVLQQLIESLNTTSQKDLTAALEVNRRASIAYVTDMNDGHFQGDQIDTNVPPSPDFGKPQLFKANQFQDPNTGGGAGLAKARFLMAKDQATTELSRQLTSASSDSQAVTAQTEELDANQKGLQTQFIWKDANRQFLRERAWVARQALLTKLSMAQQVDALDFLAQANSIKARYIQGVSDAYARLIAVADGLKAYYAYPFPDARPDPLPAFDPDDRDTHDQIVAWTRRVGQWLAAFTRRTNSYILPLSLKFLAGNTWSDGLKTGIWSFSLGNYFDDFQRHIRVRGITAWAVNDHNMLWEVDLIPPVLATVHFESLPGKPGKKSIITQDATLCRVSRVMSRQRLAVPEIGAVTAAFTGSPTGQWVVKVRNAEDRESLPDQFPDDIEIDLYLSYLFVPLEQEALSEDERKELLQLLERQSNTKPGVRRAPDRRL
jgi:hypothetical protein